MNFDAWASINLYPVLEGMDKCHDQQRYKHEVNMRGQNQYGHTKDDEPVQRQPFPRVALAHNQPVRLQDIISEHMGKQEMWNQHALHSKPARILCWTINLEYDTLNYDVLHGTSARFQFMPSPSVTFAFILATLYGAAFHLIVGGDARRLALFLLSGWLGFALGHIFGVIFALDLLDIGPLRIFSATLGALLAMLAARFLTGNRAKRQNEP